MTSMLNGSPFIWIEARNSFKVGSLPCFLSAGIKRAILFPRRRSTTSPPSSTLLRRELSFALACFAFISMINPQITIFNNVYTFRDEMSTYILWADGLKRVILCKSKDICLPFFRKRSYPAPSQSLFELFQKQIFYQIES